MLKIKLELIQGMTQGGHNMRSGTYNRYRGPEKKWGIRYIDFFGHVCEVMMERKMDAIAIVESGCGDNWDGRGDLCSIYINHCYATGSKPIANFKGDV